MTSMNDGEHFSGKLFPYSIRFWLQLVLYFTIIILQFDLTLLPDII